ncbi:MAG: PucR family transcriptional regulator [Clostridiales bacterium]|nr:PucR family transcriptional regulator [Clostridiales bacterium]
MILISEMLGMAEFKEFRSLTGDFGINKRIRDIGIHDYESLEQISETFGEGDFVLTTLFVCRDDSKKAEEYICALLDANVSAIAIKEVFFKELPQRCVEKAKEKKIPLMFYPKDIYIEDIIVKIKDLLNDSKYSENLENKIKRISEGLASIEEEAYFIRDINQEDLHNIGVAYLKQKNVNIGKIKSDVENIRKVVSEVPGSKNIFLAVYDGGIMIFIDYEDEYKYKNDLDICMSSVGDTTEYYVGYEIESAEKIELKKTINNAITAARVCKFENKDKMSFEDIGVYKMILPENKNLGMIKYSNEVISKIKKYDLEYNSNLYKTAEKYIDNNGDVGKTAEDLNQHSNTIRYRVGKLKELLGYDKKSNDSFYVELYMTMKVSKLGMNEFIRRSV